MNLRSLAAMLLSLITLLIPSQALSTTNSLSPLLGEMKWVAFNFAPRDWARCDGQLLPIASYQALYSLLGTTYGGDGRVYFALPDMRGRAMVHEGAGQGISSKTLGEEGGTERETLTTNQLPSHQHGLSGTTARGNSVMPIDRSSANTGRGKFYADNSDGTLMGDGAIMHTGQGQSHNNMMPSTTLNCIISLTGVYPSRR